MNRDRLDLLEARMAAEFHKLMSSELAKKIQTIFSSGDRALYALWLMQVAHLTRHVSAHQALVGTRINEISFTYAKFCFDHAAEEVGHEMMALNDLKKLGFNVQSVSDLPAPLSATTKLTAYLYFVSQHAHPATRLGFSYWAEKCYPFIAEFAKTTKALLNLSDRQMTFFVNHSEIDAKHAEDVELIISQVCKTDEDWLAVEKGMVDTLGMAQDIFSEIYDCASSKNEQLNSYHSFLQPLEEAVQ